MFARRIAGLAVRVAATTTSKWREHPHGPASRSRVVAERRRQLRVRERRPLEFLLLHCAMELKLFGKIRLEAALPNEVPDATKQLLHGVLLGGIENLLNREDELLKLLTFGDEGAYGQPV